MCASGRVDKTTHFPRIAPDSEAPPMGRFAQPDGLGDALAGGERGGRGAAADAEFGEDIGQVPGYGLLTQEQFGGDLSVGAAVGDEA